jgi:hypothetical protein
LATYLSKIQAAKVALPAIVVCESGGDGNTVLGVVPLPASAEEAVAVVKKFGG